MVFYDKGSYSGSPSWRYLEAAPVSTELTGKEWGANGTFITGTSQGIGTGQANTIVIVTWLNNHSEIDRAAQLCDTLVYGGKDDWFLPSKDELYYMYINLHQAGIGGFTGTYYWTSSEYSAPYVFYQYFGSGLQAYGNKYALNERTRAVRAF